MDPKEFLVWSCAIIFAATGVITLGGLIKVVHIEKGFLNKLFVALILEIVAIGVGVASDFFNENPSKKVWLVTAKVHYLDEAGNVISPINYVRDISVQQVTPTLIREKNERRVRFFAWGIDDSGRDITIDFSDLKDRFNPFSFNLKFDEVDSINYKTGEIFIGKIYLQEKLTSDTYNPPIDSINMAYDSINEQNDSI